MSRLFYTKKELVAEADARGIQLHDALIVSEDVPERCAGGALGMPRVFKGKKRFWLCDSPAEYIKLIEKGEHCNEVLPDRTKTPCFVYMDIDEASEHGEADKEAKTKSYVRKVLNAFALDSPSRSARKSRF